MLIRFHSNTGGFTIQGDIGIPLLKLMGMSGSVPGAIVAKDVPEALTRLRKAVASGKSLEPDAADDRGEANHRLSLATRAFPLIQLLEHAEKRDCDVIWEELKRSTG
jgi:hypothetical protein